MQSSDILNRITAARRSQVGLVRFILKQDELVGQKVRFCGTWLHLREWLLGGESRLLNANFCKSHWLCRACAIRRAGRLVSAYQRKVESALKELPELVPVMLTFTVRNGPDLGERVTHLKQAWSKMIEAKRKGASSSGRHGKVEFNKIVGSIRAIEVTRREKGWHPHLHIFGLRTEFIDQAKLASEWEKITGDSRIVDVRMCYNGIIGGLLETLKYTTKFSELTEEETWHTYKVFKGSRAVDAQGCLRGIGEIDIDSDEIEPELSGPTRDFIAFWLWESSKYQLSSVPNGFFQEPPTAEEKSKLKWL